MEEPHIEDFADDEFSRIAIVGMAMRFPGADNAAAFWDNLAAGRVAARELTIDELRSAGVSDEELAQPGYVPVCYAADELDAFDHAFFDISPAEAAAMDPQHRVLLETVYHALEDAGYPPRSAPGLVGLFAGTGPSEYLAESLAGGDPNSDLTRMQALMGSGPSYACTRIAYRLGLRGPVMAVDTACSTSLVATHMACRSLILHDCDIALVGGARVIWPGPSGYRYEPGGVRAPDGRCRAFDAQSAGVVAGSGSGVLVLKRLVDARRDGDRIRAVVRGSAVNNDGRDRSDYTAPSPSGQADLIVQALQAAGLTPDAIGYIEAHGTGTALGDPIEVSALAQAFRGRDRAAPRCRIGSVKSNIGHLDVAAGSAGLIKAVLALEHGQIPPSANYTRPNPRIDFERSGFSVAGELADWTANRAGERVVGVSGFGIGGTNGHVVLSEAPAQPAAPSRRAWQLLPLSAADEQQLEPHCRRLAGALATTSAPLADVAFTLATGRDHLARRSFAIASTGQDAAVMLGEDPAAVVARTVAVPADPLPVAFLFPGQGTRLAGAGRALYDAWPVFREVVDACAAASAGELSRDLVAVLRAEPDDADVQSALLDTALAQPACFAIEVALARLWQSWGIQPAAMIGHSVGEFAAAHVAGAMSLGEAMRLVIARGRAMSRHCTPGAMLAVALDEDRTATLLRQFEGHDAWLTGVNAREQCVVGGTPESIAALVAVLTQRRIQHTALPVTVAFHSPLIEPAADALAQAAASVRFAPLGERVISTMTGRWASGSDLTGAEYWVAQARAPVRFRHALETLAASGDYLLLEVGPGQALTGFAADHLRGCVPARAVTQALPSMPRAPGQSEERTLLTAVATLWQAGVPVDLAALHADEARRRVPLPGHPFRRTRFGGAVGGQVASAAATDRPALYLPTWAADPLATASAAAGPIVVVTRGGSLQPCTIAAALAQAGAEVAIVGDGELAAHLAARAPVPFGIVDLRLLDPSDDDLADYQACCDLIAAAGAIAADVRIIVPGMDSASVAGEPLVADRTLPLAPIRVAAVEYPQLTCRHVDLDPSSLADTVALARGLLAELQVPHGASRVAYRHGRRFAERFVTAPAIPDDTPAIRAGGAYLLVGGLGDIGLALAERLAERGAGRLVLTARALPLTDDPRLPRVEALRAKGIEVVLERLDAVDPIAVARLAASLSGGLAGIVNLAGVARPRLLADRTAGDVRRVLDVKRASTRLLTEHFDCAALDFLALMSSTMAYVPAAGLADYAAANGWLDAFAAGWRGAGRVVSIAWDGWDGLGLAAQGTDTPPDVLGRHPFRIDAANDWRLAEHVIAGTAILPGTATVELMLRAAGADAGHAVTLHDLRFDLPLVADDAGMLEGTALVRMAAGETRAVEVRTVAGVHARATIGATTAVPLYRNRDGEAARPMTLARLLGERAAAMTLGLRWSALRAVLVDGERLTAWLRVDTALAAETLDRPAHPALADLAAGIAAGHLAERLGVAAPGAMLLPIGCEALTWFAPLGPELRSEVVYLGADGDRHRFDVALFGSDGSERMRFTGFTLLTTAPAALDRTSARAGPALSAPRQRGLSSREGADLFEAALAGAGHANLIACRVPIEARQRALAERRVDTDPTRTTAPVGGTLREPDAGHASETERRLARLWAEQLGRGGIGLEDNFFELGGSSLDAMQIATRARDVLDAEIDVRQLFNSPSLRELARAIDALAGTAGKDRAVLGRRPEGDGAVPLAPPQQRLWALNRLGGDVATYNLAAPVAIDGPLDLARLGAAWRALLQRHESLCARVVVGADGTAAQRFDAGDPEVAFADLRSQPGPAAQIAGEAMVRAFCARPFDLTAGRLARAQVVVVGPDRHLLALVFHHLVVDHWSVGVIYADLLRLYRGDLPAELNLRYGDYAAATAGAEWGERIEHQLAYWQRRLTGAPQTLALPCDHAAASGSAHPGATLSVPLAPELVARLERRAAEARASLSMLVLTAYAVLLQRLTGQRRMLIGSPVANRPAPELEHVVGFFSNTVALDIRVDPAAHFRAALEGVRETMGEALANQEAGFEQVVDRLKVRPQAGRSPLFQTLFVLQNAPMPDEAADGLRFSEIEQANDTAKFELSLTLYPTPDQGLTVLAEYRSDLFEAATIARWLADYAALLMVVADDLDAPLAAPAGAGRADAVPAAEVEEFVL